MTNKVKLNIPAFGSDKPPIEGEAIVTVNGVPIEAVISISLNARARQHTKCTLTFYASIDGELIVEDKNFKFGTLKDLQK